MELVENSTLIGGRILDEGRAESDTSCTLKIRCRLFEAAHADDVHSLIAEKYRDPLLALLFEEGIPTFHSMVLKSLYDIILLYPYYFFPQKFTRFIINA
tara:strand:- start:2294 stop:2590 length:297 start_codon:yes stop_codon:yes gene_type:complete